MGAVGKVLGADDKAFFVFLCGAVGGCIIAWAFCDCHGCGCVCVVCDELRCVGGASEAFVDGLIVFAGKKEVDFSFDQKVAGEKNGACRRLEAYRWHQMTRIERDDGSFSFLSFPALIELLPVTPLHLQHSTTRRLLSLANTRLRLFV